MRHFKNSKQGNRPPYCASDHGSVHLLDLDPERMPAAEGEEVERRRRAGREGDVRDPGARMRVDEMREKSAIF